MESDHDQGDDQGAASQANVRSYECNFCKRGFSNAQALGGHMNIHRKDKAKLRQQSSNQTQPSLEGKSDEEHNKPNWNLNVSQQEHVPSRDEIHHMKQLPLFAESPIISSKTQKPQPEGQIHGEITKEEALSLSAQGSSSELDLELRLGPEPQDSSAATEPSEQPCQLPSTCSHHHRQEQEIVENMCVSATVKLSTMVSKFRLSK